MVHAIVVEHDNDLPMNSSSNDTFSCCKSKVEDETAVSKLISTMCNLPIGGRKKKKKLYNNLNLRLLDMVGFIQCFMASNFIPLLGSSETLSNFIFLVISINCAEVLNYLLMGRTFYEL